MASPTCVPMSWAIPSRSRWPRFSSASCSRSSRSMMKRRVVCDRVFLLTPGLLCSVVGEASGLRDQRRQLTDLLDRGANRTGLAAVLLQCRDQAGQTGMGIANQVLDGFRLGKGIGHWGQAVA